MSSFATLLLKFTAEFGGTAIVTMAVGITGGSALAVATTLFVTMAATQMISGAHFNPAITLGIMVSNFLNCKFDLYEILV